MKLFTQYNKQSPLDLFHIGESNWVELEAKALSNIMRWGGQFDRSEGALSVASHCILVSRYLHEEHGSLLAYAGLHHDIEEAFGVGDIPTPIKRVIVDKECLRGFKHVLVENCLPGVDLKDKRVKFADCVVALAEANHLGLNLDEVVLGLSADERELALTEMKKIEIPKSSGINMDRTTFVMMDKILREINKLQDRSKNTKPL